MRCKYYIAPTVFLMHALLACLASNAQLPSKKEQLQKLFMPEKHAHYKQYFNNSTNELEGTAALLFVGYKNFLSSQDMNSCVFTPSCSVYAIQSLQHDNPVKAYLKIFDRLSRCHPIVAKGEYPIQPASNLYYDPAY